MTGTTAKKKRKTFLKSKKERAKIIFCCAVLALPVLQQLIFYIGVNFNSFLQAFQIYDYNQTGLGYTVRFSFLENFKSAVELVLRSSFIVKNSAIIYAVSILISLPLALIFSFYIYKKFPLSGLFSVFLYMPQIVSALVFSLLFKYLTTEVYSTISYQLTGEYAEGLLLNQNTRIPVLVFFNIWISFGVNIILYSGAMAGIDPSIVESAELDGTNLLQEFLHITFPMIFPTFISFIIIGLAGFCTNQANLYNLFGPQAQELSTIGYYIYAQSNKADYVSTLSYASFGELSALGIMLTLIVAPVTLGVKKLLEKIGPSVD